MVVEATRWYGAKSAKTHVTHVCAGIGGKRIGWCGVDGGGLGGVELMVED